MTAKKPSIRQRVKELSTIQDTKGWGLTSLMGSFSLRASHEIEALGVDPTGSFFVTKDRNNILSVFEARTGDKAWEIERYYGGFALHPDGRRIFVECEEGTEARSLRTGKPLSGTTIIPAFSSSVAAFSQDGRRLLLSKYDQVSVYDLHTRSLVYQANPSSKQPLALAPSGRFLIAQGLQEKGAVEQVYLESGQITKLFSDHISLDMGALLISPDETRLYARGWKGFIVYDLVSGMIRKWYDHFGSDMKPWTMALSSDGSTLALAYTSRRNKYHSCPELYDARSLRFLRRLVGDDVQQMSFTPNGKGLVVCRGAEHEGAFVEVLRVSDGKRLLPKKESGHGSTVTCLSAIRPKGARRDTVISGSADGTIRRWTPGKVTPETFVSWGLPVASVDIDQQGTRISACDGPWGSFYHSAGVWRAKDRAKVAYFQLKHETRGMANHYEECVCARLSPDGTRWAQIRHGTAEADRLILVELNLRPTEHEVAEALFTKEMNYIAYRAICWLPDGERLLVTDNVGVALVDAKEKKVLRRFQEKEPKPVISIALDHQGGAWLLTYSSGGSHTLMYLSLETGLITQPSGIGGHINALSTSTSGWLATLTTDGIQLYHGQAQERIELGRLSREASCLALSSDARQLFVGTRRGPILVFSRT